MKIIERISERIEDEIKDAKNYTLMAIEIREDFPEMSRILFTIGNQEMEHMRMLHDGVTGIIQKYRAEHGEPPEKMLAVYEYLHEKQIREAADAKLIQSMYK